MKGNVMIKPTNIFTLIVCFLSLLYIPLNSSHCNLPERGPAGPQGPTGPAGPISLGNFASFSISATQTIVAGDAAIFDSPPNAIEGNISYDSLTGTITLPNPGYYQATFGLSANASDRQFALTLNGSVISGSRIDTQTSQMQGLSLIFASTTSSALLRLVNNSGTSTNVTTSTANSISAYLILEQIE